MPFFTLTKSACLGLQLYSHQNLFRLTAQTSHPPLSPPNTVSIFLKLLVVCVKLFALQQPVWLFHSGHVDTSMWKGIYSPGYGGCGFKSSWTIKAQSLLTTVTRMSSTTYAKMHFDIIFIGRLLICGWSFCILLIYKWGMPVRKAVFLVLPTENDHLTVWTDSRHRTPSGQTYKIPIWLCLNDSLWGRQYATVTWLAEYEMCS